MSWELARSEGSAPGSGIDIHPLEDEEFEAVCSHLPGRSRTQHEHRMAHQKAGRSFYLIAWVDGVPAGHVGILFPDHRQIEDRCEWGDVGIVSDLWVEPAFRGRGAGRALMQALEREAVRADLPGIGLDTGLHEGYDAARALYRSLGYVDKGGVFIQSAALPADSVLPSFFEILTIWMKPLPQVRRLRLAEVDRLQAGMPSWNASEYAKRFAAQVRGELVQVVAWLGDEPIGRGMVL